MTATVHLGDCLDVLAGMEPESFDSCVTDPPYGLSQGAPDSFGEIFANVAFPCLADFYAKRLGHQDLPFPLGSVSLLDFVNRAIGESTRIAVPEGAVDLQGQRPLGKVEVEGTGESPVCGADDVLPNMIDAGRDEEGGNFILQPRASLDLAGSDSIRRCVGQLGPRRFAMRVVAPLDPGFSRFLRSLDPSGPSFLADLVGRQNDATGKPESTASIVASARAEDSFVLSFDLAGGTLEILAANGAFASNPGCDLFPVAKNVGASAGATSLPAMFKPVRLRVIGDKANRAVTFYFHKRIIDASAINRKGFMGKEWDGGVPGKEYWQAVYRVMKPGAYLVAFGGTRTYHRLTCAIEDAGFEIRDSLMWVTGSGFPKSHCVSKALDRMAGAEREVVGYDASRVRPNKVNYAKITSAAGVTAAEGVKDNGATITAPATEAARQWQGWGTALKPAFEPIVLARKPLSEGTVAANVLKWGTGGINVDACRVDGGERPVMVRTKTIVAATSMAGISTGATSNGETTTQGRWPSNLSHDGSPEALAAFARFGSAGGGGANAGGAPKTSNIYGAFYDKTGSQPPHTDTGTAARFFPALGYGPDDLAFYYSGKANKKDRAGSNHPTVKPIALCRWLCRLITPPGGKVLDCFAGSGAILAAAVLEGFVPTGIELTPEHHADILRRLAMMRGEDEGLFAVTAVQEALL